MTSIERNTFHENRMREARRVTTGLAVICAAGLASAVVPAVEHAITTGLLLAAALVALVLTVRVTARWVRDRREDRADALVAAAWRAQHAPHLLTDDNRQTAGAGAGRGWV